MIKKRSPVNRVGAIYFFAGVLLATPPLMALPLLMSAVGEAGGNTLLAAAKKRSSHKKHRRAKSSKKRRRRTRWCNRSTTASYRKMRMRWQKKLRIKKPQWRYGYRDLTLLSVNTGTRVRFFPFDEHGEVTDEALAQMEKVMADKDNGATHPVHPRLVKLLYRLAVRFDAPMFRVISGYREPDSVRANESHHADGTAIDIMMPGVKLAGLAKVARRLGHVGVGYYPVSGFVHVDVRKGSSYFWVDPSGPGKRTCIRQIMHTAGPRFDRSWRPQRDEPEPKRDKKGNLLGAPLPDESGETGTVEKKTPKAPKP